MWIFLADSFLSVVDMGDPTGSTLLVRARRQGDIERAFPDAKVVDGAALKGLRAPQTIGSFLIQWYAAPAGNSWLKHALWRDFESCTRTRRELLPVQEKYP